MQKIPECLAGAGAGAVPVAPAAWRCITALPVAVLSSP